MKGRGIVLRSCLCGLLAVLLWGSGATGSEAAPIRHSLQVYPVGEGAGRVVIRPRGTVCSSTCEELFREGTEVTLVAVPEIGNVFDGWSGPVSCTGRRRCTFTMSTDLTIGYTFSVGAPHIKVAPLSRSFDDQAVGGTPQGVRVVISNGLGKARLSVSDMSLGDAVNFSLVTDDGAGSCGSASPVLDARERCTVKVLFNPQSAGNFRTTLAIASDDSQTPVVNVYLSGAGVVPLPAKVTISLPAASSVSPPELAYRMIGIPVIPADDDIFSTLCPFFGGDADPGIWKLYRLVRGTPVEIQAYGEDTMTYGKGWWIISSEAKTLEITGTPLVGRFRRAVPAGYFLLACPFHDQTVRWADVLNDAVNSPLSLGTDLFTWDGSGQYVSVDTLEPGKAYLAFAGQGGALRILRSYPLRSMGETPRTQSAGPPQPPPPPPPSLVGEGFAPVP